MWPSILNLLSFYQRRSNTRARITTQNRQKWRVGKSYSQYSVTIPKRIKKQRIANKRSKKINAEADNLKMPLFSKPKLIAFLEWAFTEEATLLFS